MKSRKTKKALSGSILALVLCFVMLIGTTFAWFTSSDSTAVNTIQAGTLKVGLEMASEYDADGNVTKWVDATGETLNFVKASDAPHGEQILWEPGATYTLPAVRVVNNGNLALKYKVVITAVNGDSKLAEVLNVSVSTKDKNGATATKSGFTLKDVLGANYDTYMVGNLTANQAEEITISMTMDTKAGNAYQGLSISGVAITVMAAQDTVEYDSTTNQYDKDAKYAEIITTAEELVKLATAVNDGNSYAGKTVCLAADIDLKDVEWIPIGTDANLSEARKPFSGTFDGAGHTIKNLSGSNGLFGLITDGMVENLNIADANINSTNYGTGILANRIRQGGVIENVTVNGSISSTGYYTGGVVGAITGNFWSVRITNCTNNATVSSSSHQAGGIAGYAQCDTTFENCKNTGAVSENSGYGAGGIVGFIGGCDHDTKAPTINNCENSGTITSTSTGRAGGIVGGFGMEGDQGTTTLIAYINNCTTSGSTTAVYGGLINYETGDATGLTLYINGVEQ